MGLGAEATAVPSTSMLHSTIGSFRPTPNSLQVQEETFLL